VADQARRRVTYGVVPSPEREACEKSVSCECSGIMTQHVQSSNQKRRLTRLFSPSPSKFLPLRRSARTGADARPGLARQNRSLVGKCLE
jgi:hypothetical protein